MITTIILGSAAIAALISIIGTLIMNVYLSNKNFKNDYLKIIINKRIETYELIEDFITILKISVLDVEAKNNKPYHQIFSLGHSHFINTTRNLTLANGKSIWLNEDTRDKLIEILNLINNIGLSFNDDLNLIEGGRIHYKKIAELRDELELLIQNDILTLYDFNKMKKVPSNSKYQIIKIP